MICTLIGFYITFLDQQLYRVSNVRVSILLSIERSWNMWIPGFGNDEIRPFKKQATTEAHKQVCIIVFISFCYLLLFLFCVVKRFAPVIKDHWLSDLILPSPPLPFLIQPLLTLLKRKSWVTSLSLRLT